MFATRQEYIARLKAALDSDQLVIGAGAGTGISAKCADDGQEFVDAAFSAAASGYVGKARLCTDLIPPFPLESEMKPDGTWYWKLV
jgi:predicted TIM-barrel enzyme